MFRFILRSTLMIMLLFATLIVAAITTAPLLFTTRQLIISSTNQFVFYAHVVDVDRRLNETLVFPRVDEQSARSTQYTPHIQWSAEDREAVVTVQDTSAEADAYLVQNGRYYAIHDEQGRLIPLLYRPVTSEKSVLLVRGKGLTEIYIANQTGKQRLLTTLAGNLPLLPQSPSASPDGNLLVVEPMRGEYGSAFSLVNLKTGDHRPLDASIYGMNWSPDSRYLAYTALRNYQLQIIMQEVATGEEYPLWEGQIADYRSPAWSPDGKYIAFTAQGGSGLYVAEMRDGDVQDIRQIQTGYSYFEQPAWSPDGELLAYTTIRNSERLSVIQNWDKPDQPPQVIFRASTVTITQASWLP